MNVPGRAEGNWRWRCTEDMLSESAFQWLRDLTKNVEPVGCSFQASDEPAGQTSLLSSNLSHLHEETP